MQNENALRIRERLERLDADIGSLQAIDALRQAVEGLTYVTEANTLLAAKTTAGAVLLGMNKTLAAEGFNRVVERLES